MKSHIHDWSKSHIKQQGQAITAFDSKNWKQGQAFYIIYLFCLISQILNYFPGSSN